MMLVSNFEKGIQCLDKGKRLGATRLNWNQCRAFLGQCLGWETTERSFDFTLAQCHFLFKSEELIIMTCTAQTKELKFSFFNKKFYIYYFSITKFSITIYLANSIFYHKKDSKVYPMYFLAPYLIYFLLLYFNNQPTLNLFVYYFPLYHAFPSIHSLWV